MSIFVRLRHFIIPAGIGLMLLAAILFYNLSVLPKEREYFDNRNFRSLQTLSSQIFESINAFDKMMDNATDSGLLKGGSLRTYFKSQAPYLEEVTSGDTKTILGDDYGDPPKIAVATDEGTHFLYLGFKRGDSGKYVIRTDLEQLVSKLSKRCPFEEIVLAQSDGTVIYQTAQPSIHIAHVSALENASDDARHGKADKLISLESLSQSSTLHQVSIAGASYRLYAQPLQPPFAQAHPHNRGNQGSDNGVTSKPWILCGLVRDEQFRAETQSYSETELLWISAVILLAIGAFPFLKLCLSSPSERVRRVEVTIVAIFTCFVATIFTFVFLDLAYWTEPHDELRDQQMRALAHAIDKNFREEREAAISQLQNFYDNKKLDLSKSLIRIQARSAANKPTLIKSGKECRPALTCRVNIRSDSRFTDGLDSYPYLLFATWTNLRGQQVIKWTTRNSVTPFLDLEGSSIPYYPAIKRAFNGMGPMDGIGSQYSPNTGENITIFWKIFDQDGKPPHERIGESDWAHRKWFCASLVTKPISVVDPLLPAGFQFAIITLNGAVIFHSDETRNLRENFFAETDEDEKLRSRVAMRAEGPLAAKYMGRSTILYILPMTGNPNEEWTVVVFRGLQAEQSANLELIIVASMLFICYGILIVLTIALLLSRREGRQNRTWFWPDSAKTSKYIVLVLVNALAATAQLFLSQLPTLLIVLIWGTVIPLVIFACNLALLNETSADPGPGELAKQPWASLNNSWQLAYVCACATLVAVIAILPCFACFKIASDLEQKIIIKSDQSKLAADSTNRKKRLQLGYQDANLGKYWKIILAPAEAETKPYFSYHSALDMTIQSKDPQSEPYSLDSGNSESQVEEFLSGGALHYAFASDELSFTEPGSSEVRTRRASFPTGKHDLILTQKEEGQVLKIVSPWQPNVIPWHSWRWWAEVAALMTIFFLIVQRSIRKIFLLDLVEPRKTTRSAGPQGSERLFRGCSQSEKLALVQLAQEGIVNSKDRNIMRKLIDRELVGRERGLLRVTDSDFLKFVMNAVPCKTIQEWEKNGADVRLLSLRSSLWAIGICLLAFLIYSRSDVLGTWATLVGGLATLIPASLQLLNIVRSGGKTVS